MAYSSRHLLEAIFTDMTGTTRASPMERALAQARATAEPGEVPIGAVIMRPSGEGLAEAGNRTEETNDPTAHAETLAISASATRLGTPRPVDCRTYASRETSPM